MSFSADHRTLINGKTFNQNSHPKMFVNAEVSTDTPVSRDSEKADEPIFGVSPDLIEEKIKAVLEPLNEQISMLTQLLNKLIQKNSARNFSSLGPRTYQTQSRHSPSGEVSISRTLPGTTVGSTGFPTDRIIAV